MTDGFARFLRGIAASLASVYGVVLVATLWMRELTETAVVDALIGSVYLTIGIGLYGRSRFSLFLAIAVSTASVVIITTQFAPLEPVYRLRNAVDGTIAALSLIALWQVRNNPSV